jgi:hypothetical protein
MDPLLGFQLQQKTSGGKIFEPFRAIFPFPESAQLLGQTLARPTWMSTDPILQPLNFALTNPNALD